ncbi:MAG: zinc-dependent alcohol dehydrogenase family protein [Burkholderiaceae bacterium]
MSDQGRMRALVVEVVGGPFEERLVQRPLPTEGQVLVRIFASGVNPLDTKIRAGAAPHAKQPLPAILGMDLAGVVEALGPNVSGFRVGDEVYGLTGGVGGLQGSLAEFAAVDAQLLAPKPHNLSMREAAALPLSIITAWEGLVDRAKTEAGNKVLVHGGAGGVGHVAVQIARALGAEVYATVRSDDAETMLGYGATPIDYTTTPIEDYVAKYTEEQGFDVIYDTVGGKTLDASFAAARIYGGHVVSCLGWGNHALAPLSFRAATYSGVFTLIPMLTGRGRAQHGHILREAKTLIEAGQLSPLMSPHRFNLGSALQAHQELSGRSRGKVVVDILT